MEAATRGTRLNAPVRTYAVTLQRLDLDLSLTAVTLGSRFQGLSSGGRSGALLGVFIERESGGEEERWRYAHDSLRNDLSRLGLDLLASVSATELPRAVMLTSRPEDGLALVASDDWRIAPIEYLANRFAPGNAAEGAAFAEYVAFAPVMPVESSPLNGQSLGAIVSGVGGGAVLVASGQDPLLLVKAGIGVGAFVILVGSAKAVAEGLDYRIKRWFGVEDTD